MPRFSLRAASAVLLTLTALNAPAAHADEVTPVTVTVNARAGLATVPDTALGVNHAIWDSQPRHQRDRRTCSRPPACR